MRKTESSRCFGTCAWGGGASNEAGSKAGARVTTDGGTDRRTASVMVGAKATADGRDSGLDESAQQSSAADCVTDVAGGASS